MTPSEKQSIGACAGLRSECQRTIFTKMDIQQKEVMDALGKIDRKIAFQEGQEQTRNANSFRPLLRRAVVMWSPAALFLMVVGFRQWGITRGWW